MVIFFAVFSTPTVMFLGGEEYTQAITPMIFILLSVIAIGIGNVIGGELLIGSDKEKIVLISDLVGLSVNLLLNYFLILKLSTLGAAIATLITEIIVTSIQLSYARFVMKIKLWKGKDFFIPALATGLGIAASFFVMKLSLHCIIQLVIGGLIFGIVYLIVMLLFKDEIVSDIWKTVASIVGKILGKRKAK